MKIPTSNIQHPEKFQASTAKGIFSRQFGLLNLGIWSLEFPWNLKLGCWNLLVCCALLFSLFLTGCVNPVRAEKTSVSQVYREMRHSALDGGQYSNPTRQVLRRYDWEKSFGKQPAQVLQQMHEKVLSDERTDLLFALAELNYFYADRLRRSVKPGEPRQAREFYLASSIYAWLYLSRDAQGESNPFDQRFQLARDLYNRGLAQGLLTTGATNGAVTLEPRRRQMLAGPVELRLDTTGFPFPLEDIAEFVMADAYSIIGLSVRNRQVGLGAPLIASSKRPDSRSKIQRMPVTAFLRIEGDAKQWSAGQLKLSLQLYSGYEPHFVMLGDKKVPVAVDSTAPVAYGLNDSAVWRLGLQQFLSSQEIIKSGIYPLQPYQTGAIPVVFIHGTFSSPIYWAEMWNTLEADPQFREHYQAWTYIYNSGNPITFSAANLREALNEIMDKLDPDRKDPALQQMVLIGHSQGGLLAKLAVTPTEDKIWRIISDEKLEDVKMSETLRAEIRRNIFVEPLPYVKRVIFMATPHHGSYLSTRFARKFAAKLMRLPRKVVNTVGQLAQLKEKVRLPPELRGQVPTSLDGMSPRNPFLLALADLPPAPGVKCNSIVAVKGKGPVESGKDGVVAYKSAHVSYAESELVVRSYHSCQGNPAAMEEVRRILLEHLAQSAKN